MQRDHTLGVVQWPNHWTGIDGEQISLIITAYFQALHVPAIEGVLSSKLPEICGEDISFRLDPGELSRQEGSSYEPGCIVITGLTEDWPDGSKLREAIEAAWDSAREVEQAQTRRANALKQHLVVTGFIPGVNPGT